MTHLAQHHKATVRAGSNIAFIKYWGVADKQINLPLNNSISMTLADAFTTTTVAWDLADELKVDEVQLDGQPLVGPAARRLVDHLDRIRTLAGVTYRAWVSSENNFPTGSGIASSASGFAALTAAACAALHLDLSSTRLSALARRGSGSASRSLFGGYVEWDRGHDDDSSVARPLYPPDHWDLRDVVAVVSSLHKPVSSAEGHRIATTSPMLDSRISHVDGWLAEVRQALVRRDLAGLGRIIELDALAMHSVMMTSTPRLLYWQPGTVELLQAVQRWREKEGLPVFFTIDAGPNVHLICEPDSVSPLQTRLAQLSSVQQIIVSRPGGEPQLLDRHLF